MATKRAPKRAAKKKVTPKRAAKKKAAPKRTAAPKRPPAREPAVGELVDAYDTVKLKLEDLERTKHTLVHELLTIETLILHKLGTEKLEAARGLRTGISVSRDEKEVPQLDDWQKLCAWIKKGKGVERFSLFQRRFSSTFARAAWDEGSSIPGVKVFTKVSLKVTGRGRARRG